MDMKKLNAQLIDHEGLHLKPYRYTAGKLTIGVGRNLDDVGISEKEAMFILNNDIEDCLKDVLEIFPNFSTLSNNRQMAIVDMRFNLGPSTFRKFKKLITAVKHEDWDAVGSSMKNSRWYGQVGNRAIKLRYMMLTG